MLATHERGRWPVEVSRAQAGGGHVNRGGIYSLGAFSHAGESHERFPVLARKLESVCEQRGQLSRWAQRISLDLADCLYRARHPSGQGYLGDIQCLAPLLEPPAQ